MEKQLLDKAIVIKNKKYILVADRILYFNEAYLNGSIETERLSEGDREIIKATVTPDCDKPNRKFTGYSQATWGDGFINKTSALENCETSAVGRALAMMGIGVIDSIASVDEINKANNANNPKNKVKTGKIEFTELDYQELEAMTLMESKEQIKIIIEHLNESHEISNEYKEKIKILYNNLK